MPGIHPASRRQVQWAFAAEARGQFGPKPGTPWTSPEAKQKRSLARDWAHRWKCWSWDEKVRGKLPKDCKAAIKLLEQIRTEHPNWKVPDGIKRAAPKPKVVRLVTPVRAPPMPIAARGTRKTKVAAPKAAKPKTAKPKKARTKTRAQHKRRRSDVITADELIAAALGQF